MIFSLTAVYSMDAEEGVSRDALPPSNHHKKRFKEFFKSQVVTTEWFAF
jgi:hypothetical protein